jgi:hypothetical protein
MSQSVAEGNVSSMRIIDAPILDLMMYRGAVAAIQSYSSTARVLDSARGNRHRDKRNRYY